MSIGFIFWLLMLLWLVLGLVGRGSGMLLFILLFLLGWKIFGFPIQG